MGIELNPYQSYDLHLRTYPKGKDGDPVSWSFSVTLWRQDHVLCAARSLENIKDLSYLVAKFTQKGNARDGKWYFHLSVHCGPGSPFGKENYLNQFCIGTQSLLEETSRYLAQKKEKRMKTWKNQESKHVVNRNIEKNLNRKKKTNEKKQIKPLKPNQFDKGKKCSKRSREIKKYR